MVLLALAIEYLHYEGVKAGWINKQAGLVEPAGYAVVGSLLGFLIVFRMNSSANRYWEGRSHWGMLINSTRSLARCGAVYAPPAQDLALLIGGLSPVASLVFVLLYGLGNGMNTIVKGTAMAQYVSRQHVGQLNGLLGLPIALARAAAPLTLGLLWSPQHGYTLALWWLLLASLLGTAALWSAQSYARAAQH